MSKRFRYTLYIGIQTEWSQQIPHVLKTHKTKLNFMPKVTKLGNLKFFINNDSFNRNVVKFMTISVRQRPYYSGDISKYVDEGMLLKTRVQQTSETMCKISEIDPKLRHYR